MSGIPVYTNSPINASLATGSTPQTAAPQDKPSTTAPASVPATTTASAPTVPYTSARPGAGVPAPTASARSSARSYAPLQPTPTTKMEERNPPQPQPGAFPIPLNRSNLPPPPKAGEHYEPPQQTAAPQAYPSQMFIPPPTTGHGTQPPASTTRTTTTASHAYPAPIAGEYGAPRLSHEHPPGYQQNVYAADLTADQRRAHGNNSTGQSNYNGSEKLDDTDSEGLWSATTKWAQTATQKISDVHDGVWEMINKK